MMNSSQPPVIPPIRKIRKGRFAGSLIHLFLIILVFGLMISSAGGFFAAPAAIGRKKLLFLALFSILVVLFSFLGDALYEKLSPGHAFGLKLFGGFLFAAAPAFFFVLAQLLLGKDFSVTGAYLWKNLLLIYWIFLILCVICRRVSLAGTICGTVLVLLALTEYYVYLFRGQGFTLLDLASVGTAMEVADGYHFEMKPRMCALLLMFFFFQTIWRSFQKLEFGKRKLSHIGIRAGVLAAMACVTFLARGFALDSENVYLWNVNRDYTEKGYVYTLARELRYLKPEKPDGYSVETVEAIADSLESGQTADGGSAETDSESAAENDNAGLSGASAETAVTPENIIVIMNESFADLESVGEIAVDEEILANFHALASQENVESGLLHVPGYGGGTSLTEYEVLTGNSMRFLPDGSAAYQLYTAEPEYGMVTALKAQGYTTVAIHPNKAKNWSRNRVYTQMHFDSFISRENWEGDYDKIRKYASDETAYRQIIRQYEGKSSGEKLFTFCITMQNHGGYGTENMKDYEPDVKLNYEDSYPLAETWLSLEKESDQAFADLISYFEEVDEPTMIVLFGDHWPQLEEGFFTELFGKDSESLTLTEVQTRYTTPYLIWTNYETSAASSASNEMSANYFGACLMSRAGLSLTEYQQFLLELYEDIPVIGASAVKTAAGEWIASDSLDDSLTELIANYKILQYNNVFDRKNRIDRIFSLE